MQREHDRLLVLSTSSTLSIDLLLPAEAVSELKLNARLHARIISAWIINTSLQLLHRAEIKSLKYKGQFIDMSLQDSGNSPDQMNRINRRII
jgi:hypothetical protein